MSNIHPNFPLATITITDGTQARVEINQAVVEDYAEKFREGVDLPPIKVMSDGTKNQIVDGCHRYLAMRKEGILTAPVEVLHGTLREAILYSLGANDTHGLRRSNADKRKAVETMLKDDVWATWAQGKIAAICKVSVEYVNRVWNEIKTPEMARSQQTTVTVERDGKEVVQRLPERKTQEKLGMTDHTVTEQAAAAPAKPATTPPKPSKAPAQERSTDPATMTDFDIEELVAENARLKAELVDLEERRTEACRLVDELKADNDSLVKVFEEEGGADRINMALKEAKVWRETANGHRSRIDGLMTEKSEAVKIAGGLRKVVDKLEKEIAKLKGETK